MREGGLDVFVLQLPFGEEGLMAGSGGRLAASWVLCWGGQEWVLARSLTQGWTWKDLLVRHLHFSREGTEAREAPWPCGPG